MGLTQKGQDFRKLSEKVARMVEAMVVLEQREV